MKKVSLIFKSVVLAFSLIATILLIMSASDLAKEIKSEKESLRKLEEQEPNPDDILDKTPTLIKIYKREIPLNYRRLAGQILGIITIAGLNFYVWLLHRVPTKEDMARAKSWWKEKRASQLEARSEKLKEKAEKVKEEKKE